MIFSKTTDELLDKCRRVTRRVKTIADRSRQIRRVETNVDECKQMKKKHFFLILVEASQDGCSKWRKLFNIVVDAL